MVECYITKLIDPELFRSHTLPENMIFLDRWLSRLSSSCVVLVSASNVVLVYFCCGYHGNMFFLCLCAPIGILSVITRPYTTRWYSSYLRLVTQPNKWDFVRPLRHWQVSRDTAHKVWHFESIFSCLSRCWDRHCKLWELCAHIETILVHGFVDGNMGLLSVLLVLNFVFAHFFQNVHILAYGLFLKFEWLYFCI